MPDATNPYLPSRWDNLSNLLISLGAGITSAEANRLPTWAGIGPGAAMFAASQNAAQDRATRAYEWQQQFDQNEALRKAQEQNIESQIAERGLGMKVNQTALDALNVPQMGANPTGPTGMVVPTGTPTGFANNIGNIRTSPAAFEGKGAPYNGFETFDSPLHGAQAMFANLRSYVQRNPDMTVGQAISTWAPPTENNTQAYIAHVAGAGIDPNAKLADVLANPQGASMLMSTMALHEKGALPQGFTPAVFRSVAGGTPAAPPAVLPVQATAGVTGGPQMPPPPSGLTARDRILQMSPLTRGVAAAEIAARNQAQADAWKRYEAQRQAQVDAATNANRDVAIDPATGQPVVNETAVGAKARVSAAQGTDVGAYAQKQLIDQSVKEHAALQSNALQARTGLNQLDRLNSLLGQVSTGKFQGTAQDIKAAAKALGIDLEAVGITDNTGPAQAAQALANQFALQLRNPAQGAGMPGQLSDRDVTILQSMIPSLDMTPEGIKLLTETMHKMYQRSIDVARIANDWMRSGKLATDPSGMFSEIAKFADEHPLFSDADIPKPAAAPLPQYNPATGKIEPPAAPAPAGPKVRRYNPATGKIE